MSFIFQLFVLENPIDIFIAYFYISYHHYRSVYNVFQCQNVISLTDSVRPLTLRSLPSLLFPPGLFSSFCFWVATLSLTLKDYIRRFINCLSDLRLECNSYNFPHPAVCYPPFQLPLCFFLHYLSIVLRSAGYYILLRY